MRTFGVLLCLVAAACSGAGELHDDQPDAAPVDMCSAGALQAALSAATEGQTVTVGACTIEGEFEVPAGVTLLGAGVDQTEIVNTREFGTGIYLTVGATGESTVRDLTVRTSGQYGIAAANAGRSVLIDRVRVIATRGEAGIDLEDVAEVTLDDVELVGSVVKADQTELLFMPDPDRFPTVGVRLFGVDSATLTNITGGGFESAVVFMERNTAVTIAGANLSGTATNAIFADEGDIRLTDVVITELWKGYLPSAGVLFRDAQAITLRLTVTGSEARGMVQEGGSASSHTDFTATDSAEQGLKLDGVDGVAINDATVSGSHGAGILMLRSRNVMIDGGAVSGTIAVPVLQAGGVMPLVGDGIEMIRPQGPMAISNVTLTDNERAGLLIEVGAPLAGITLTAVTVSGTGAQLGAIAQDDAAVIPSGTDGWDTGVTRQGATVANDPAVTTRLPSYQ